MARKSRTAGKQQSAAVDSAIAKLQAQHKAEMQKVAQFTADLVRHRENAIRESFSIAGTFSPYGTGRGTFPNDYIVPQWRQFTSFGAVSDRRAGQDRPLIYHSIDTRNYRGMARWLVATNPFAIGFKERLTDFVVGTGHEWTVKLKGQKDPDAKHPVVQKCQAILDHWKEINDWGCGYMNREPEQVERLHADGEIFLRLFRGTGQYGYLPIIRNIEPEQITTPPGETDLSDYSYGILNAEGDIEKHLAYWVQYQDDQLHGEEVSAHEMLHLKVNTVRSVKRGVTSFLPINSQLESASNLLRSLAITAEIQAKIAYIRQHGKGVTNAQINEMIADNADLNFPRNNPTGSNLDNLVPFNFMGEGAVIDMKDNMQFDAGPASQGTQGFIAVEEAVLRGACVRFGMPEFFTSNANNANFASLLAAGSPFERSMQRQQTMFAEFQKALAVRILRFMVEAKQLRQEQLDAIEINITPPSISMADAQQDETIRAGRYQNGIISKKRYREEIDIDHEQMESEVKQEQKDNPMAAMMGGGGEGQGGGDGMPAPSEGPGDGGPGLGGPQPEPDNDDPLGVFNESAQWDESKHDRADDGKFTSGGGSGGSDEQSKNTPKNDAEEQKKIDSKWSAITESEIADDETIERVNKITELEDIYEQKIKPAFSAYQKIYKNLNSFIYNRSWQTDDFEKIGVDLDDFSFFDAAADLRSTFKKGVPKISDKSTTNKINYRLYDLQSSNAFHMSDMTDAIEKNKSDLTSKLEEKRKELASKAEELEKPSLKEKCFKYIDKLDGYIEMLANLPSIHFDSNEERIKESYFYQDKLGRFYDDEGFITISEADRSHLVKKVITNKAGRKQTVYVNPNAKQLKPWFGSDDFKKETKPLARETARKEWSNAISTGKADGKMLAKHLDALTDKELKGMLKELNQKVGGLKKDKVKRLVDAALAQKKDSSPNTEAKAEPQQQPQSQTSQIASKKSDKPNLLKRIASTGINVVEKGVRLFNDYVVVNNPSTRNPLLKPMAKEIGGFYALERHKNKEQLSEAIKKRKNRAKFAGGVHGAALAMQTALLTANIAAGGSGAFQLAWIGLESLLVLNQLFIYKRLGKVDKKVQASLEKQKNKVKGAMYNVKA